MDAHTAHKPIVMPGDTIGVFSPSSYVERNDIEAAQKIMENHGYKVVVHPQTFERFNQSAGTHKQKLEALHALYQNPEISAIWAAGGGNRSLHLLDGLNFDIIANHPKPMIGFSDVTALLNTITARTGITNIHGPVFKNLSRYNELNILISYLKTGRITSSLEDCAIIYAGKAAGLLYGGNLSVFQYLLNAPPSNIKSELKEGVILFLEDCNEELSRLDRMFLHLRMQGVFEHINGLILGEFVNLQDSTRPFGFTLEDIVREHTTGLDIPIVMNAPFGHGNTLPPYPIGKKGFFDTETLTLCVE